MQLYLNEKSRNLIHPYGLGNITNLYKNAIEDYNKALIVTASKDQYLKKLIFKSIIESENMLTIRYDLNRNEFILFLNFTYIKQFGLWMTNSPIFHITTNKAVRQHQVFRSHFRQGGKFKSMKPKLGSIQVNYKSLSYE